MGVMLAANWPDKLLKTVRGKSSLIDLEARTQVGDKAEGESHRERLNEKTSAANMLKRRCDSPNPERLLDAITLWEADKTYAEISRITGIPERTLRRYLNNFGYKRDYKYVSRILSGRPKSVEANEKVSITRITRGIAKGENNPNWKGGIQSSRSLLFHTPEYKLWRKSVFERDGYTCKGCGSHGDMEAHHILPVRDFPHLTTSISNGITLCIECHNKTRNKEYLSINIWRQRV